MLIEDETGESVTYESTVEQDPLACAMICGIGVVCVLAFLILLQSPDDEL